MNKTPILISILSFFSFDLYAQTAVENNIEASFQSCLGQTNGNTMGISMCTEEYFISWDSLLNAEYQLLINNIPRSDADRLRNSQRKWLETKELDHRFNVQFSDRQEGTMWGYTNAYNAAQSTKYRALYLHAIRMDILRSN